MPNQKPKSGKSLTSGGSSASLESVGIGAAQVDSRYISDGFTMINDRLYDCVVALIYCPQHAKVAVVHTRREHIVWAPFLQLRDGVSWTEGTLDCIQGAIGRQDPESKEADATKETPKFEISCFEITQIQAPSVNSIFRICQLITLKPSSFKCCTKNRQIEWVPLAKLVKDHNHPNSHHWGPELRMWCSKLEKVLTQDHKQAHMIMHERTIAHELKFYASEQKDSAEHKALLGECHDT